jgi:hypothetical protein
MLWVSAQVRAARIMLGVAMLIGYSPSYGICCDARSLAATRAGNDLRKPVVNQG